MLSTRGKLKQLIMNINEDCPFCHKVEETIDHVFITYDLAINVWCTIESYCLTPNNSNQGIIYWIEYLRHNKSWY